MTGILNKHPVFLINIASYLFESYWTVCLSDFAKYLQKGKNIIEAEAETFNRSGGAGVNIISEIVCGSNTVKIESDENWSAKSTNGGWKNAVSKSYPFEIIAPNFSTKRTSWIER